MGNKVYLYASEDNEADCDELITIITKKEQEELINVTGPENMHNIRWDNSLDYWMMSNERACNEISKRKTKENFICISMGVSQLQIVNYFNDILCVEYGVGYEGVCTKFVIFESYAWMHAVYTAMYGSPFKCDGRFYDEVIPNYYDINEFPLAKKKGDYYLYIGRLIQRKGLDIAIQACNYTNSKLIIAGNQGDIPSGPNIEYVGLVGVEERGKLMSRAKAVFVPTIYVEPFGGVSVESLLCGTPVICTDWGAFPENIKDGVDGFRIRTLGEAIWAMEECKNLDSERIRRRAQNRFSVDVIKYRYQDYFDRLRGLWTPGQDWNCKTYNPTNKRRLGNFL
jgi:glycosyltransferase involved in cell wall biosynthesis